MLKKTVQLSLCFILLTSIFSLEAKAATITLPQTGQTFCYDEAGAVIDCADTGQDGETLTGLVWIPPRFTDNSITTPADLTITDNLTGLIWNKNPLPDDTKKNWQGALDYVKTLNSSNYLGHNDWRLPNINELESLLNHEEANYATWLNGQGFSGFNSSNSSYYWSSTTYANNPYYAWYVYFNYGYVYDSNKNFNYYVRCVRGGQSGSLGSLVISQTGQTACYDGSGTIISCSDSGQDGELQTGATAPTPRFVAASDQTITDTATGLVWSKEQSTQKYNWQGALDYIKALNSNRYLGYTDWQMPNRNELESLLNYSQSNLATWLNGQGFSGFMPSSYWSSTTSAYSKGKAWYVYFGSGGVFEVGKDGTNYVRPVRGRQLRLLASLTLSVSKTGTGSGNISSSTRSIDCGSTCSASIFGTTVTLTATPEIGSGFEGWSGACSGTATTCTVTMDAAKNVGAAFATVTLPSALNSTGMIWTSGGDANWGGETTVSYDGVSAARSGAIANGQSSWIQTSVTDSGILSFWWKVSSENNYDYLNFYVNGVVQSDILGISGEVGWIEKTVIFPSVGTHTLKWEYLKDDGTASGSDTAWIDQVTYTPMAFSELTITKTGNGTGSISSSNASINCSPTCSAPITSGTAVTLTAIPDIGSGFDGWSGACTGTAKTCTVTVDAAKSVGALFTVYAACGSSHAAILSATPTSNICTAGNASPIISAPRSWSWSCSGTANNEVAVNCIAFMQGKSAVQIPQTGQTACYDAAGAVIACVGTRQDGETVAGLAWPNPRFTDNSVTTPTDLTITDNLTGLIWSKNALPDDTMKTWQGALDYVKTLNNSNYLGHNDWRLPNINELKSLVNQGEENIATWLDGQGITGFNSNFYWSSTTQAGDPGSSWDVYFGFGFSGPSNKSYSFYVRCVRGGQSGSLGSLVISQTGQTACYDGSGAVISCSGSGQDAEMQIGAAAPTPRFVAGSDQTVTDASTLLVWSKEQSIQQYNWQEAIDYIKGLNIGNYLGYSDWRLPNRNELESLVNHGQSNPATWLNGEGFNGFISSNYWSSTTIAIGTLYAWALDFSSGYVADNEKSNNSFYVRPVRGGQTRNIIKSTTVATGDITGDGTVDIADALRALQIAIGIEAASPAMLLLADVAPLAGGKPSPDGVIDIADALVILEKSVGLVNW
jgi:hypothetical protein